MKDNYLQFSLIRYPMLIKMIKIPIMYVSTQLDGLKQYFSVYHYIKMVLTFNLSLKFYCMTIQMKDIRAVFLILILECRKVIGIALALHTLGRKKSRHFFPPIRSKAYTNRDALTHVFPRFASSTCVTSFDWFTGV